MARALRHTAPQGSRQMIVRPRLLALVRGRFERAVTVVVAKPGAGKTTLLTQAVTENAMAPRGKDFWLTCQRDDTSLSVLAKGAFVAVGVEDAVPDAPHRAAAVVADAMWSAAPADVALILDDAHHLSPGSPGAAFLNALLEELPRNGHVVLGWRTDPALEVTDGRPTSQIPPGVSRLLASEDALLIEDAELQFTGEELTAFADSRDVPASVLWDVGGWPALAELAASVGQHAVVAYLWDQLLSELPRERRHALAVLAEVGGADDEIASALLGRRVQLSRLLEGLPLVVRDGAGWWSLHALWGSALQHLLDEAEVAGARRATGRLLAQRGHYDDAMSLLLDAEAWPDALEVIVDVCKVCTPLAPQDFLELWWSRLPGPCRERPEGLLLHAMVVEPADPGAAERLLTEALAAAADTPNLQYACINALAQVAFWRNDRDTLRQLVAQLDSLLRGGFEEAEEWLLILTALLEPSIDRAREALLSAHSPLTSRNPVQQWLLAHILLRKMGDAVQGEDAARRSLEDSSTTMRAVSRAALIEALKLQGRLAEAREMLPDLEKELEPSKLLTSPELLTHSVMLSDLTAPPSRAESLLARYTPVVARSPVAWAPLALTFAEVFHAVTIGDEAAAVALLDQVHQVPLIHNRASRHLTTGAVPLLYLLKPDTRPAWDDYQAPDGLADLLAATRALVALRERGSVAEVVKLPPRALLLTRTMMPVPWAAELALGMVAANVPQGRDLIEELRQRARPVLRDQTTSSHPLLARTAKSLLRTLPVKPAYELELRVLGSLELRYDGKADSGGLRRERVRHLLAYLLAHERPTRAEIMEALWPDLSESAAKGNLRVTLAYLNDALEPDRREGDATYFVRSSGPVLHLVVGDGLQVDVVDFERELDEARRLEGKGVPSEALHAYLRGLELWRGDYFAETSEGEGWLGDGRDRLRRRFTDAAVRAGQLLTAAGDLDAAEGLAERALRADPWEERAHQVLIQASVAAGDLDGAGTRLERCLTMLRDLGVPPATHTGTLAQQIRSQR